MVLNTIITTVRDLFGTHQLTVDEVLSQVPKDWICTIYGDNSLRARLQHVYGLPGENPSIGELHHLLSVLRSRGQIEYEQRLLRTPPADDLLHFAQCRLVSEDKPDDTTERDTLHNECF